LGPAIAQHVGRITGVRPPCPRTLVLDELRQLPPPASPGYRPTVSVAVCTRNRPQDMERCLAALSSLRYPSLEIVVVDNAPQTDATERLVRRYSASMRYVRESRPGLGWARNRAISETRGEVLAFTDDDVMVDAGWLEA